MNKSKNSVNFGRAGDGSPIETRSQARGIVEIDRRKQRSKGRCRSKGRQANPRNRDWS